MEATTDGSIKKPRLYFYHTRLTAPSYEEWTKGRFPGHLLYGQPLLQRDGYHCVMHPYRYFKTRWGLMWYTTKQILSCREPFDIIYGTSFRGLELIILLRALRLYRKPVVIWHHTPLRKSVSALREAISRLFYQGIDHMFMFSNAIVNASIALRKVQAGKMQLVHWGPDLPFYDALPQPIPTIPTPQGGLTYISTGKENRDIETLLRAFAQSGRPLDIYISPTCGYIDYKSIIDHTPIPSNIQIHYTDGVIPYELAKKVNEKSVVVIACLHKNYTVGLTTLVEALALGKPVICSENTTFEIDIDKEGIGLTVPDGDAEAWIRAIHFLDTHPDEAEAMGKRARALAEKQFNMERFAKEIEQTFDNIAFKQSKKH